MENNQDFTIRDGGLNRYRGPGRDVTIPEGVTEIRWGAFYGCPKLANQQGMVIIHGILFEYMGSNRDVTIPAGVTETGWSAFKG